MLPKMNDNTFAHFLDNEMTSERFSPTYPFPIVIKYSLFHSMFFKWGLAYTQLVNNDVSVTQKFC